VTSSHRPELLQGDRGLGLVGYSSWAVILDVSLPGKSGFEVARELRQYFPRVFIIFLTTNPAPEYVEEAFALGASAYVLKVFAVADLPAAVRSVLSGRRFTSPFLLRDDAECQ
jgi:DNA-binding NarL/FixJ family response regulator